MENISVQNQNNFPFNYLHLSGIYAIQCIENNRIYVGKSLYVGMRICSHIHSLDLDQHKNNDLALDYEIYGIDGFRIFVICECDPENLELMERRIMQNMFKAGYSLYNRTYLEYLRKKAGC